MSATLLVREAPPPTCSPRKPSPACAACAGGQGAHPEAQRWAQAKSAPPATAGDADTPPDGGGGGRECDCAAADGFTLPAERAASVRTAVRGDGFFRLDAEELPWPAGLIDGLARGVVQLLRHGWTPTFIFVYDEAWMLVRRMRRAFRAATGGHDGEEENGNDWIGDIFAWCVRRPFSPPPLFPSPAACCGGLAERGKQAASRRQAGGSLPEAAVCCFSCIMMSHMSWWW